MKDQVEESQRAATTLEKKPVAPCQSPVPRFIPSCFPQSSSLKEKKIYINHCADKQSSNLRLLKKKGINSIRKEGSRDTESSVGTGQRELPETGAAQQGRWLRVHPRNPHESG